MSEVVQPYAIYVRNLKYVLRSHHYDSPVIHRVSHEYLKHLTTKTLKPLDLFLSFCLQSTSGSKSPLAEIIGWRRAAQYCFSVVTHVHSCSELAVCSSTKVDPATRTGDRPGILSEAVERPQTLPTVQLKSSIAIQVDNVPDVMPESGGPSATVAEQSTLQSCSTPPPPQETVADLVEPPVAIGHVAEDQCNPGRKRNRNKGSVASGPVVKKHVSEDPSSQEAEETQPEAKTDVPPAGAKPKSKTKKSKKKKGDQLPKPVRAEDIAASDSDGEGSAMYKIAHSVFKAGALVGVDADAGLRTKWTKYKQQRLELLSWCRRTPPWDNPHALKQVVNFHDRAWFETEGYYPRAWQEYFHVPPPNVDELRQVITINHPLYRHLKGEGQPLPRGFT